MSSSPKEERKSEECAGILAQCFSCKDKKPIKDAKMSITTYTTQKNQKLREQKTVTGLCEHCGRKVSTFIKNDESSSASSSESEKSDPSASPKSSPEAKPKKQRKRKAEEKPKKSSKKDSPAPKPKKAKKSKKSE